LEEPSDVKARWDSYLEVGSGFHEGTRALQELRCRVALAYTAEKDVDSPEQGRRSQACPQLPRTDFAASQAAVRLFLISEQKFGKTGIDLA
jgi:hypothetical protein